MSADRRPDHRPRHRSTRRRPVPASRCNICDIEVDKETGVSRVVRYTAIQDVGKAMHPSFVEGQMQGGAAQGIGWALNEEYIYDADGAMQNAGFLDYRMPVASDLPMIDTVIVEVANPLHPYGVRGVGEVPIVPPLARRRQRDARRHRHPLHRAAAVTAARAGSAGSGLAAGPVATIYFSSSLSRYTGGVDSLTVDAPRVQELMQAVIERFPDLAEPLAIMSVAVDGEIHQHPEYLELSDTSEVHLVPRISGGDATEKK